MTTLVAPFPLRRARVGLVVTAGAHLPGEAAFGTVISAMGLVPRGPDVLERSVPAALERLRDEEVDLALLVPA